MIQGWCAIKRARNPLPQTTIGSDSAMPKATSSRSPWAAAATASTLSRLMVTSATTMIQIASRSEVPRCTSPSWCSPGRTRRTAIQSSSSPPAKRSSGIVSSALTTAMKVSLRPTAAAVPHTRPSHCSRAGSERTASAITSALSPASDRSIRMMLTSLAQNSGSTRKPMPGPISGRNLYGSRRAHHQPMPVSTVARVVGTGYSRAATHAPSTSFTIGSSRIMSPAT